MRVRVYRPARSTMQAALRATRHWVIEFPGESPSVPDPLMGWTSSAETRPQVRLRFNSLAEAIKFAQEHGWDPDIEEPGSAKELPKSYAANFSWDRKTPWSH
jgi:hypothetical protein